MKKKKKKNSQPQTKFTGSNKKKSVFTDIINVLSDENKKRVLGAKSFREEVNKRKPSYASFFQHSGNVL